jgi:hypothetical protein
MAYLFYYVLKGVEIMAKKITTFKELEKYLMSEVVEILNNDEDKDSPKQVLKDSLDSEFYDLYTPSVYDPSPSQITKKSIMSSATQVGNKFNLEVYHDTDMMSSYAGLYGGDSGSYYRYMEGGRDISQHIPDMIENGEIYPYNRSGYTEKARRDLEEGGKLRNFILKGLNKKGYNAK